MAIRVVLADDHALVREGTKNILQQSGDIIVVGEAADGEEAVRLVQESSPDVALLDVSMPRLNGIEATRRIKSLSPATAVLALTIHDDDAYVFALLEAGAAGYLTKNAHGDELVRAVHALHAGESVLAPSVARKVLGRFVSGQEGGRKAAAVERLTGRQHEVLRLAARGLTNKAIGKELSLSARTVQLHLRHIFGKLGVASRTGAVTVYLKQGGLRLEEIA